MTDCKVTVDPGVCKLKTVIVAKPTDDMMGVTFEIKSECPNIRKLAEAVKEINPYEVVGNKMTDNAIYRAAGEIVPHAACPVPCAMLKAMEAGAGLGLKRDVHFTIE